MGACRGGIGKTIISTWLVRQTGVLETFSKIAWVTLGQTPNIDSLRGVLYQQLTGGAWDSDWTDEAKVQQLGDAFAKQKILLVLDDLWDSEHEKKLNYVDANTASKVLVSSRVRATLSGGGGGGSSADLNAEDSAWIVQLELPSEEQAVKMLLSTAGMSPDQTAPKEALDLVKFCNKLPLAISIAGQLVKDLELEATADWDGIVSAMKEEFADGSRQSVEDTVILTSLKSITGTHKDNVITLFKCLALVPEDTVVPLDALAMIFEAGASTDEKPVKRPSILSIRRWLKVLIERSLVLGTVDRMSMHDIVRDHVLTMYTEQELQQAHRRVVELLRHNRPQSAKLVPAWEVGGQIGQPDRLAHYVGSAAFEHVKLGWLKGSGDDWESDELAINEWLGDCPQDAITLAAGKVIGLARLEKLVAAAEAAGDHWLLAKRAILLGQLEMGNNREAMLSWWRRGLDALGEVSSGSPTPEQREVQEGLEISTFAQMSLANDPADARFLPRMEYLLEQEHANKSPFEKALIAVFVCLMKMFGDLSCYGRGFVKVLKIMAHGARTHPDERVRPSLVLCFAIARSLTDVLAHRCKR